MMDLTQTTVHLPAILHSEVKRQADVRQMSMSEMTRRALVRYLDIKPKDLLQSALRLENEDQKIEWSSIWGLVDNETTTAYEVVHDLIILDVSNQHRTDITLSCLVTDQKRVVLSGERATLISAACLAEPDVVNSRLLDLIEKDLQTGRRKRRQRAAHLLERTGRPPVSEILDLLAKCTDTEGQGMLLGYLSHLGRRNTVANLRRQLIAAVVDGLSSKDKGVVLCALELAASLRAGELLDELAGVSNADGELAHGALVSLGAISAKGSETTRDTDEMFSLESPLSYRREGVDRPLRVPSWQHWSVRDAQKERALAVLIRRAESGLTNEKTAATIINGIARSKNPEGLRCLMALAKTLQPNGPMSGRLIANALGQFDEEDAQMALQEMASRGSTATRRVALKVLHSKAAVPEIVSAGPPTELFTLASLLRVLASRGVDFPMYELDLNRHFSALAPDHATARRWMIGLGLMDRDRSEYTLTPMGESIATVERWLEHHGVRGARRVELLRSDLPPKRCST